jgi:hypothetical protein
MNSSVVAPFSILSDQDAELRTSLIRALLYFDIFNHPLSKQELRDLIPMKLNEENHFSQALEGLLEQKQIYFHNGFYSISPSVNNSQRRIKGEERACAILKRMQRFSGLIASFPFVKGVTISGSLSKNYMDENSDIDYFIITTPNRLWVARTLLIIYKKMFLFNSKKNFCVNYFVSEDQLSIPDRNIFTATEVSYLIPVFNYSVYYEFMRVNSWSRLFYPNFPLRKEDLVIRESYPKIKVMLERVFSNSFGEKLDTYFFKLTLKRWKKKFKNFDENTFDLRMRSKRNVSKHHPNGFQEKVLNQLQTKIAEFEKRHDISLSNE